jgi:hypothetical protein
MKRTLALTSIVMTVALTPLTQAGTASAATQAGAVDVALRSSSADAEEGPTRTVLNGPDLDLGEDRSSPRTVGLRFTGIEVPQGATITRAVVQFQADEVRTRPARLAVAGLAADDAEPFRGTTSQNLSSRRHTAAAVAWTPAPWPAVGARGVDQRTPDLTPVVQEIVARPGWSSGNALGFLVTGTGTRVAESYDAGASKAPALHIEYRTAAGTAGSATSPTAPAPAAPAGTAPAPTASPSAVGAPGACTGTGRTVVRPHPAGTRLTSQWEASSPQDDVTYDLSGVTSTAYPATNSVFAVGNRTAADRTCVVGGTIRGQADDSQTWDYYHDRYNAACVKIIATDWMQVRDVRCDNVEDGIKPEESGVNANNTEFYVSGTYLSRVRDDCMENDYTVGGVLYDNLWEQCNTGISERPSSDRSWSTPSSETLTLDHMLIGLYETPHVEDGRVVMGENKLFKWSDSGNRVVIKCSTFRVNTVSLSGKSSMTLPPGTVIDDSACPNNPSTIVWLGGGAYPGETGGMRVVSDVGVWNSAVGAWKAAHGY